MGDEVMIYLHTVVLIVDHNDHSFVDTIGKRINLFP